MNQTHLYIGDNIIDLKSGQVVATTIKKIDIGDITARYINRTNQLDGILTEETEAALGIVSSENSQTLTPYTLLSGKLVQNGIELIPKASILLKKVSKKQRQVKINVYENLDDYFSRIKGLKISDINPIVPSAWTAAGIDSARTNTDGIVSAILSWGKSGNIYQVNFFLPCFYYHSIVTSILEYTGLTLSGDILTDARFTDLVIPFPGKEFLYPESLIKSLPAKGYLNSPQSVVALLPSPRVTLDIDTIDYGTNLSTSTNRYTFPSDGVYKTARVVGIVYVSTFTLYDATTMTVALYLNNTTQLQSGLIISSDSSVDFDYTGTFAPGDYIDIQMYSNGVLLGLDATIVNGIDVTFLTVIPSRTIDRTMVSWNYLWPDVSCEEIIKDFFTRFALIPKQVDNILYLKSLEDIINNRANAIDWSGKIVNRQDEEIDFGLRYAQNNYFNYENLEDVNDSELGRGNIEIANQTTEMEKEIYTSIFGNARLVETNVGYRVGHIPVYDSDSNNIDQFANEPGIRLMTLKARTTETGITFNAISRTDYKLAYFVDPIQAKDTGWEYFLGQFYGGFTAALQNSKTVLKYFLLVDSDVSGYDPHKSVWDGNGYGIINGIKDFIPDQVTKVELFKVG